MQPKHSPAPWSIRQCVSYPSLSEIVRADGSTSEESYSQTNPVEMANAARIVACVNSCEGIENPGVIKELIAHVDNLVECGGKLEPSDVASARELLSRIGSLAIEKSRTG